MPISERFFFNKKPHTFYSMGQASLSGCKLTLSIKYINNSLILLFFGENQDKFCPKKSIVRFQANSAAVLSYLGVVSLWKPWFTPS